MALTITHLKVSGLPDNVTPGQIQPSDWNQVHVVAGTLPGTSVDFSTGVVVGTTLAAPNGVEGYFVSTSATDPRGIMSAQYSADAIGARLQLRKARGTEAVPSVIVSGDVLGRIRFSGYDGAAYQQMASIDAVSTGTISGGRVPTYLAFSVGTDAAPSVLTEVWRLAPLTITATVPVLHPNGTVASPAMALTSDPTTGLYGAPGALQASVSGAFQWLTGVNSIKMNSSVRLGWSADATASGSQDLRLFRGAVARLNLTNAAETIGSSFKVDALPTIASGFGGSPAITAGSTPLAGSINVGTGGAATTGVINFAGTAFPAAPFVVVTCSAGTVPTIATTSTTQLTLTSSVAWPANTIVNWICISSK